MALTVALLPAAASAQYQLDAGAFNDLSPVSIPTPIPGSNGLTGDYYNSRNFSGPVILSRVDSTLNFNWGADSPHPSISVDDFSVRWTGFINIPATGAYTLYTTSDDGVRLWVNNIQVINQWQDQGPTEYNSGALALNAGLVPVRVEYYEGGGGAMLDLRWEGPGIAKEIIPATSLVAAATTVPDGPPVTFPAIAGQTQGPSILSMAALSSASSATSDTAQPRDRFPSAIYRDGTGQPTGAVMVLEQSQFGYPFSSGVPRYMMGDFISPPLAQADGITPAGGNYWRVQPVLPGEVITHTTGAPETPIPANAAISYYYSPHARRVFASQPGNVTVKWISRLPASNGRFQFRDETFTVSASSRAPVRPLFWTERAFSAPALDVPAGRIQAVNPVYTPFFPAEVAAEYRAPGASSGAIDTLPEEKRTLWFDGSSQNKRLRAYNHEGRILVEYLGALNPDGVTYEFLGADVVEVAQVPREAVVTVKLGEEILPEDGDRSLFASPTRTPTLSNLYGSTTAPNGRVIYYAERENLDPDKVQFYWLESLDASIQLTATPAALDLRWPKYYNKYRQVWPDDPAEFAQLVLPQQGSSAATGVFFGNGSVPQVIFQDDNGFSEAQVDPNSQSLIIGRPADGRNRSLLKFINGTEFWYVRVDSRPEDQVNSGTTDGTSFSAAAVVGDRIERPHSSYEPGGYIAGGTGYSIAAYRNPYAVGVDNAGATGSIIPVNAVPGNRELQVWWFRKVNPPNSNFTAFHVASRVGRYTVSYPASPSRIVMASNQGSGDLGPSEIAGTLYVQNDRTQPGFNPNEEHALMIAGRVYALRDDLNVLGTDGAAYTSEPFALLSYTSAADNRPSMKVFRIEREDDTHKFDYAVTAGTILQGPMPLPVLPLAVDAQGAVKNREVTADGIDNSPSREAAVPVALYDKFTFRDRKGYHWVYRGPHAGSPDANDRLEFQFYYTMQESFFIPGRPQPAAGTALPYLRPLDGGNVPQGDPVTGTPLNIVYRPEWPVAPELRVAETLTLPKFGLPSVRGQTSAEILYQQSVAQQGATKSSAVLHDSTRQKTVALDHAAVNLAKLPGSIATTGSFGKVYFQLLPPHLQKRFYYDPLLGPKGSLVLKGEFVNEIAGEDYTHLNVLSDSDETKLKALVNQNDADRSKWLAAIEALNTRVETFIENPARRGTYMVDTAQNRDAGENDLAYVTDSDTAVDSYALTATGNGAGYVTLLFGDGQAFTPQGEPVSVQIIKVAPQLYTGDLKVLLSENPLDEQVTLRHSGDFAARPEDYEFEWRYSPPQDGVAPPVYTYTMQQMLGAGAAGANANAWRLTRNPGPAAAAPLNVALPQTLVIHDNEWNAEGNPPGLLLSSTSGVDYTAGVPERIVFSAGLSTLDGFVLYINGIPALATNVAGFETTDSTSGLSPSGLPRQWTVPPSYFSKGPNTVEIALYTAADRGAVSYLDFKLEGSVETDRVTAPGSPWLTPTGTLTNIAVVGGSASSPLGSPLLAMSDNYFTMRYRPKAAANNVAGTGWSRWMPAKLVEGWIKRVLAGINPFNQRIRDLLNNPVNTDVSLLTQAGTRWEGNVALNLENINDFGLIEIYETVLNRGRDMSINSGYDYSPANDALLLAAGYLNDLYQILGNEAYADAANPTISIDDQTTITEVNTSRFAFEGQVSSVLEEELALLRGRDDFLAPGVQTAPAYNRLYWNYTRGINSGEALYAVNYNIKEKAGSPTANGTLDAADAQRMFPQSHGDAYGHQLTALKGYYSLLTNPNFTWTPRSEAVTVLGQAVQVDYYDERKFARAASGVAAATKQVIVLTHRQLYKDDPAAGWSHYRDGKVNSQTNSVRHFGLDEWVSRSTQGALFHWMVGNAILPEKDTNPNHTGVQIIDRTTVPELSEIVTAAASFQASIDRANARLNPLGLGPDSVAFDISPAELRAGQSHFDQVYDRALRSVLNARGAFNQAAKMTRLLRNQENQIDDYNAAIVDEERAYVARLIEIFGTPYTNDIGPGKTYAQDYAGPDFINWFVVDRPSNMLETVKPVAITVPVYINTNIFTGHSIEDIHKSIKDPKQVVPRTINVVPNQFLQYADIFRAGGMGTRRVTGRLQEALLESHRTQVELLRVGTAMDSLNLRWRREYQLFKEMVDAHLKTLNLTADTYQKTEAIQRTIANLETASLFLREGGELADDMADAAMESGIKFFGLAVDGASPAAGAIKLVGSFVAFGLNMASAGMESRAILQEPRIDQLLNELDLQVTALGFGIEQRQAIYEHEMLLEEMLGMDELLVQAALDFQRANEEVRNVLAEGEQVMANREVFRQRAAAVVQGYRTRDLTFRTFRNEALEQYRTLFDLAGRYTYLATRSYDYETGLLGSTEGREVMSSIVASRSLGDLSSGIPQATTSTLGDSGLAGTMARLQSDWSVAKGRLGINNPDQSGTLFSLRHEKFRILNDPAITRDDEAWRQTLEQHIVRDVMADEDVGRYCLNIRKPDGSAVPGIILPFSTTIEHGRNFFGLPLAGGDHAFTASAFATKIYSAGVVLPGYVGMDVYANGQFSGGSPAVNSPLALSATPYAYLLPCGADSMRAPAFGDTGVIRSWQVTDQALPLPFNLGATQFSETQFFTAQDTLTEQPWLTRKHQAFRMVNDPALFYSFTPDEFTCRRLVGRSAWNSQWKIVIPAYTLLNNEQEGLSRFVASVKDIQLFLRTYSHSGN